MDIEYELHFVCYNTALFGSVHLRFGKKYILCKYGIAERMLRYDL